MADINLSGSVGAGGAFPILGTSNVVIPSDADYTMTSTDYGNNFLHVTSSVSLTATRHLIAPLIAGQCFAVQNATTGGQSIIIEGGSGGGVTIANGDTVNVACDGTAANYITLSGSGGGGGIGALVGDVDASGSGTVSATVVGIQNIIVPSPTGSNTVLTYNSGAFSWGSGGSGITTQFIFRPGGVASGNVYTTWTNAYNARAAYSGPAIIVIDSSLATANVDAGAWNLGNNTALVGYINGSSEAATLNMTNITTLEDATVFANLTINTAPQANYTIFPSVYGGSMYLAFINTTVNNPSYGALISTANTTIIEMSGNSVFNNTSTGSIVADAAATGSGKTIKFIMNDQSSISNTSIVASTSAISYYMNGQNTSIGATQSITGSATATFFGGNTTTGWNSAPTGSVAGKTSAGVATWAQITDTNVSASAAIEVSKLGAGSPGQSLITNSSSVAAWGNISNQFIFRPGGVASGNVFTTWTDTYNARALYSGPAVIVVDSSLATANVDNGNWALGQNTAIVGYIAGPSQTAVLNMTNITTFTDPNIFANIVINTAPQASVTITPSNYGGTMYVALYDATFTNPSYGATFGSANTTTFELNGASSLSNTSIGNMISDASATGSGKTITLIVNDQSSVSNTCIKATSSTVSYYINGQNGSVGGTQSISGSATQTFNGGNFSGWASAGIGATLTKSASGVATWETSSASGNTLIYQQNGTAFGNIYTSWTTLMNTRNAIDGPVTIVIDNTFANPSTLDTGYWNLNFNTTIIGLYAGPENGAQYSALELTAGVYLYNPCAFQNINLTTTGGGSIIAGPLAPVALSGTFTITSANIELLVASVSQTGVIVAGSVIVLASTPTFNYVVSSISTNGLNIFIEGGYTGSTPVTTTGHLIDGYSPEQTIPDLCIDFHNCFLTGGSTSSQPLITLPTQASSPIVMTMSGLSELFSSSYLIAGTSTNNVIISLSDFAIIVPSNCIDIPNGELEVIVNGFGAYCNPTQITSSTIWATPNANPYNGTSFNWTNANTGAIPIKVSASDSNWVNPSVALTNTSTTVTVAGSTISLTSTQLQPAIIVLSGTLTASITVAFGGVTGMWFVNCAGVTLSGHTLTFTNGAGTTAALSPSTSKNLYTILCSSTSTIAVG